MYNQNYYGTRERSIFFKMRDAQYKCTHIQSRTTGGHSQWMTLMPDEVTVLFFSKDILLNYLRIACLRDPFFLSLK